MSGIISATRMVTYQPYLIQPDTCHGIPIPLGDGHRSIGFPLWDDHVPPFDHVYRSRFDQIAQKFW